ncbi:MAG: potassium-transporting ATPase subunit KdpA [Oligoflexia bacterium]|nr:potassium-transporting ATPase subunit KdpA [Oligoflexia bacterium]
MNIHGLSEILLYFMAILLLTAPMGILLFNVFEGRIPFGLRILRPLELLIYRVCRVDPRATMRWQEYSAALLIFSLAGALLSYALLRLQGWLPLNPQAFGAAEVTPDLAFNTAVSFTTNTNWQSYVPEATVSMFSNMLALAMHNWMSAAAGMAVAVALSRGFSRADTDDLGNFWVDLVRGSLYVLFPIALLAALAFVHSGAPQNFSAPQTIRTLEGAQQIVPQGPVASQEAIKQLGTNGGGYFNANSAHPYENPTAASDLLTKILIFLIPAGLTYMFGKMVGNQGQGWALFGAMGALFIAGALVCYGFEQAGNPHLAQLGIAMSADESQPGGNMEGKETRFGIAASALFASVTTAASCGAVNSMHDSFTPIGGLVPLFNILSGEAIFGGVGAGLYGMLMFVVLAIFIAGLMVGRTPEYVGKKIGRYEVQMAMLALLVCAFSILGFSALSSTYDLPQDSAWNRVGSSAAYYGAPRNNVNNAGSHGLSEMIYAFASATGNNGSAFAGITANTPFYNLTLGVAMLAGRFLMILPLLAMAGSLVRKKRIPESAGTFPTDSITFAALLVGTILIVGALTFFPGLALGPIVEHFQLHQLTLQ